MPEANQPLLEWHCSGRKIFPAMLAAIAVAEKSIRLETYIYADGRLGRQFLEALVSAATRGVRVRVLVDALGSWLLPHSYFEPLITAGAEVRRFNPLHLWRFGVRNHRKLLVCDDAVAFVGGFNIADEYDGDGVSSGWCDIGFRMQSEPLARQLASSFDELFQLADFHRKPLMRWRAFKRKRARGAGGELLLAHPGRGASPFQTALYQDLAQAKDVSVISAYFLPTRRLRRELFRVVRRGGRVRLILAGKSDVLVSQFAARSQYRRFLKAGVEIYEYQPQILHAKLVIADNAIYAGSSNLDIRSLNLNYELMLRLTEPVVMREAREIFENTLKHCRRINLCDWQKESTFWRRWKNRWAHLLLTRIDPYVALKQFRSLH